MAAVTHLPPGGSPPGGRVPPHNLEAEESVLGSMMLSRSAVGDALEVVDPEDFYRDAHARICEVIRDLFGQGEPPDAITVGEELRRRGSLDDVGGLPYLHTLVSSVPTAANVTYYAKIVNEHATLRRLIDASTQIASESYDVPEDVELMVGRAEDLIMRVGSRRLRQDFRSLGDLLMESMEHLELLADRSSDVVGVPTGFYELDDMLSGMQNGNLIIVAARPAMGKSSFAMNVAQHVATSGKPVVFFSLEMSWMEIVQRLICAEARVDTKSVRQGKMDEAAWMRVSQAVGHLAEAPLFIDDTPSITMGEIIAKCRRLAQQQGDLGLIVVDYLQLMTSPRRNENRVQEVSEISRALKILAKQLDVPVIAVSQLSRAPEQHGTSSKPRKPRLSDLRDSGSIEQDADVVMFVYREEYYDEESERRGEADILVEKHRNGPTGTVALAWLGQYTKFENLARG